MLLHLGLSFAIGACITAGLLVARAEWQSLRAARRLSPAVLREMRLSLATLPLNVLAMLFGAAAWTIIFISVQTASPWTLTGSPIWLTLSALIAADISYYFEHRCAHRSIFLWRLYHGVHHTSSHYNVAAAYRVSFLHQLVAPVFYLPWVLLGFDALLIMAMQLMVFHYQAWVHTEHIDRLRFLDGWLNTPANHRMHHSADLSHTPRNFGAVLMVWDRMFGTYVCPSNVERYGIAGAEPPTSLWQVFMQPLK